MADDLDFGATLKGFQPGQMMFKRYKLERILGRGGMGVVWLAEDQELERKIALKFLPEIVAMDVESVSELKRETRRNLELTHPHIVRIYDFVQDTRSAAISMELVEGASLSAAKVERKPGCFPIAEVKVWAGQLCDALSYAHERAKIVHRDLKPANLMLDGRNQLKVTDFGIACSITDSVSRVSRDMGSSGTPLYMSPQQLMGEVPSATDDIYSMGATLYELITGKPPFYTGNVILQVQNKVPPGLAARRAELGNDTGEVIPVEWETVIAACLAKESEDRPISVSAMAEALGLSREFSAEAALFDLPGEVAEATPKPLRTGRSERPPDKSGSRSGARAELAAAVPLPVESVKVTEENKPVEVVAQTATKTSKMRLIVAVAVAAVVVMGVGVWAGDGPNRYKASQQMKAAQQGLFASDWPAALASLRSAVELRPTDVEYRREFDDAQVRWLEMVEQEGADRAPLPKYNQLVQRSEAAISLVEPYSESFRRLLGDAKGTLQDIVQAGLERARGLAQQGEFQSAVREMDGVRNLTSFNASFDPTETELRTTWVEDAMQRASAAAEVSEFETAYGALGEVEDDAGLARGLYDATFREVEEAEMRYYLTKVDQMADKAQFATALERLEELGATGVLPEAIELQTEEVRRKAEVDSLQRLVGALKAGQGDDADRILRDYAAFTESEFNVTGSQLMGMRDLTQFLTALEELRLRPREGQPREGWRDVSLVASIRGQFENPAVVKGFLQDGYAAWAGQLKADGRPGLALYLAELAKQEGASYAAAQTNELMAALPGQLDLKIRWNRPQVKGEVDSQLRDKPWAAIKVAVEQQVVGIFSPATAGGVGVLEINSVITGLSSRDDPSSARKSVRYKSGTTRERNSTYYRLEDDIDDEERTISRLKSERSKYQDAIQRQRQASQYDAAAAFGDAMGGVVGLAMTNSSLSKASNRLSSLRAQLRRTDQYNVKDVYKNENYDVLTHNMTYEASFTATPQGDGGLIWRADKTHQTVEVNGNEDRGVPVRKPSYPSTASLNADLSGKLVDTLRRNFAPLIAKIAPASFRIAQEKAKRENLPLLDRANKMSSLLFLWRAKKVEPQEVETIDSGIRNALGLPTN